MTLRREYKYLWTEVHVTAPSRIVQSTTGGGTDTYALYRYAN